MRITTSDFSTARFLLYVFIGAAACSGIGCGIGPLSVDHPTALAGKSLHVTVMGGRKPISGSSLTLYEAGTTSSGNATVLATTTTNASGQFNIDSFTCGFATSELYMTASGGDAGNGVNSNIELLAALGPCNALPDNVNINELSTVAAAYAFNQFMHAADPSQISASGAPGTDHYIGIANASLILRTNLVQVASGSPSAVLSGNGNSPATINTLADVLVACVNAVSPFSVCDTVFGATTPTGGDTPTTTLQAAYDIAAHPAENVSSIFGLLALLPSGISAPFTPTLSVAPTDLLLGVRFVPAGINIPEYIRIDLNGNVVFSNYGSSSIMKLSPTGAVLSPAGGFKPAGINGPKGFTVDSSGNIWIANYDGGTVEQMSGTGTVQVPAFAAGIRPASIVLDSFSHLWIADAGGGSGTDDITVANLNGTIAFGVMNGFAMDEPFIVLADTTVTPNIMWVTNSAGGAVSRLIDDGTTTVTGDRASSVGTTLYGMALNSNGEVWVGDNNAGSGSISKISNTATPAILLGPITGGGITSTSQPAGITVDSGNDVWVNNLKGGIAELDNNGNPIGPSGGFTAGGLIKSPDLGIFVDRSGNLWVTNTANGSASVVQLIGAAKPVITPRLSGRPIAP
jgi:streptogramin lyase